METPGLVVHGEAVPFSTALRSLVNNPRYSDVCFVVGQERQEVFAHRCLLACRCNFFQRLLGVDPGPEVSSPVVLSTVPAEAFLTVLEFLYTNSVKLHRHSVSPLGGSGSGCKRQRSWPVTLWAEGQGKLPSIPPTTYSAGPGGADGGRGVRAGGTARGGCNLWPGTTAGVLRGLHRGPQPGRAPYLYNLTHPILQLLDPFACSQEALRTRGFLELSATALLPLLRSDKLCVDEAELVRAAWSWARVGAAVLEQPMAEVAAPVVRELRLALLAPAELSALEEQNRREPLIPVEQIVEAWKCHALRRGDAARGALCRRRKGTLPREHHRFLDLPFQ
ncbi:BTB/POZ domain-containing protein 19 isoform X3 [Choloepus didactylus]|uniref:BTB/POZ domain-containing protein 19 isoform X3 n=1 Tax=Choloepus didactylus TaxID=27675 RepID=UPI0018A084DA|nr:BTB/POZ domain-containing protein 19 isoform X3 [Choloepus didactylus]